MVCPFFLLVALPPSLPSSPPLSPLSSSLPPLPLFLPPPLPSLLDRRRCPSAEPIPRAGPLRGQLPARRQLRPDGARHRAAPLRAARAAGGGREPPGAGGMIGVDAVAKAPADGYTIGLAAAGALSFNGSWTRDALQSGEGPGAHHAARHDPVLPHRASVASPPAQEVQFSEPSGTLSYGHGGNGSAMHLGRVPQDDHQAKIRRCPTRAAGRCRPTCSAARCRSA